MPRYDRLPDSLPPRGLHDDSAAQYLGVSRNKFREMVEAKLMPAPIRVGGRIVWDRVALDRAMDALSGVPASSAA